jgi:hypothetical protein
VREAAAAAAAAAAARYSPGDGSRMTTVNGTGEAAEAAEGKVLDTASGRRQIQQNRLIASHYYVSKSLSKALTIWYDWYVSKVFSINIDY